MLERIKKLFMEFFSSQGPGTSTFLDGMKEMLKAVVGTVLFMIPQMVKGFAKMITEMLAVLKNPPNMPAQGFMQEMGAMIMAAFGQLADALADDLWPAIMGLWDHLWDKHRDTMIKVTMGLFALIFGKAIIGGILSAMISGGVMMAFQMLGNFLTKKLNKVAEEVPAPVPVPDQTTEGPGRLKGFVESLTGWTVSIKDAAWTLTKLALGMVPAMLIFAGAIAGGSQIFKAFGAGMGDTLMMIGSMLIMIPMMHVMIKILKGVRIHVKTIMIKLGKLGLMLGALALFALALGGAIKAYGSFSIGLIDTAQFFATMAGGIMGILALTMMLDMGPGPGTFASAAANLPAMAGVMAAFLIFGLGLGVLLMSVKDMLPPIGVISAFFAAMGMALISVAMVAGLAAILGTIMSSGVGALIIVGGLVAIATIFTAMRMGLIPGIASMIKELDKAGGANKAVMGVEAIGMILQVINDNFGCFCHARWGQDGRLHGKLRRDQGGCWECGRIGHNPYGSASSSPGQDDEHPGV